MAVTTEEVLQKVHNETYNWDTKGICESYVFQMIKGESVSGRYIGVCGTQAMKMVLAAYVRVNVLVPFFMT